MSCYYKKIGVPKGKFQWIPEKLIIVTNTKDPKFIWVPASKPYDAYAGKYIGLVALKNSRKIQRIN